VKHLFRILAIPDPQALPRVLGVLAQRSLMPDRLSARHVDGRLRIALALDLDAATARIIAAKLLEAFLVVEVVCQGIAGPNHGDR
jgi:hypothetical protein